MPWFFDKPTTIEPVLVVTTEPAPDEEKSSDCAWCGSGEGICAMHTALLFAQSEERKERRTRA